MLRRNTRVSSNQNGSSTSMRRGGGRCRAAGGGATQAPYVPRTREGRPAEASGPRLRDRRPLEPSCAALCSRPPALRAPPAVRAAASSGWARRWWGALSVAVQLAVASTALGRAWLAAPLFGPSDGPALDRVLDLATNEPPSPAALNQDCPLW